jgi:hypothetical protein
MDDDCEHLPSLAARQTQGLTTMPPVLIIWMQVGFGVSHWLGGGLEIAGPPI